MHGPPADVAADPGHVTGRRDPGCTCSNVPLRLGLGNTQVTALATDASGNCSGTSFVVTVQDTTAPTIDTGDVEVVCATARIPYATVRDNGTHADDIGLTCFVDDEAEDAPGAGTCDRRLDLPHGGHHVDYTAVDEEGNDVTVRLDFTVGDQDPNPPVVELVEGPEGYLSGDATLTVRVVDNCDGSPGLEFTPAAASVAVDGSLHTATWTEEGEYGVDVLATDASGNRGTLSDVLFGIDRTAPTATFSGLEPAADPDDRATWPVLFPGETIPFSAGARDGAGPANSGIATVTAVLEHLDSDRLFTPHFSEHAADGEPAAGPVRLKNLACNEPDPDGPTVCDGGGDLSLAGLDGGDWLLTITVRDHAGNVGTLLRHFTLMTWREAMDRAVERAAEVLAGGVDQVTALFLEQVVDIGDEAGGAVEDPELLGNALLYTYTVVDALVRAESAGADTAAEQDWLDRGAYVALQRHYDDVEDEVGEDDPDVQQADDYLQDAQDHRTAEPPAHLASLLAQMNAYFYLEHALEPFVVTDDVEASLASRRLVELFAAYLENPDANGRDTVQAIAAVQADVERWEYFEKVIDRAAISPTAANNAFLDLLVALNDMASLLAAAQDEWVWVRNWQWPVSLQVRVLGGVGIESAAIQMDDDPDDPEDALLVHAKGVYDEGVEFIDDRLVDDALDVYIEVRCLIHEVYNHAGFHPPAEPDPDWGCPECVLTGDCVH